MAELNPLIPLGIKTPDTTQASGRLLQIMQAKNEQEQQEEQSERQDRLLDLKEQQMQAQIDKDRQESVLIGAATLDQFLEKGDVEGAKAYLKMRGQNLIQNDKNPDDTFEALEALNSGDTEQLRAVTRAARAEAVNRGLIEPKEDGGFTLSKGQVRFDEMGNEVASVKDAPDLPTGFQRNEQGEVEVIPAYRDFKLQESAAGKTDVSVDARSGPQVGTIPQGWQLNYDDDGRPVSMSPIPGGPAEQEIEKAAEQDKMKQAQKERYADVVTEDIDRALNIVDTSDIPVTGFGSYLSSIPGTAARDLKGLVDTIRANVGFDRLQQMRDASPTGGALGQVSELENRLLQATLGNLELSQSEEQFKKNLSRVKDIYTRIINEGIPEKEAEQKIDEVKKERPDDGPPEGVDPEVWQFMTPEEKALFQ